VAARLSALHASRTLPPGFFIFKDSWYSFLLDAEPCGEDKNLTPLPEFLTCLGSGFQRAQARLWKLAILYFLFRSCNWWLQGKTARRNWRRHIDSSHAEFVVVNSQVGHSFSVLVLFFLTIFQTVSSVQTTNNHYTRCAIVKQIALPESCFLLMQSSKERGNLFIIEPPSSSH
jgi:hypothetical protein